MQRPLVRLAMLAAVVAATGLASCRGESPTESVPEQSLFATRDSGGGDSIPPDTIPPDTIPPDTIPPDTIPPDTIPPDTIPPDTVRAFDLIVTVVAADSSFDTLQTVRLQGARVKLLRFDSPPDSASVPNAVTPARPTNRSGMVTFHRLRPAWYRVEVTPPRGGANLPGSALVAPATSPRVPIQVLLLNAP